MLHSLFLFWNALILKNAKMQKTKNKQNKTKNERVVLVTRVFFLIVFFGCFCSRLDS